MIKMLNDLNKFMKKIRIKSMKNPVGSSKKRYQPGLKIDEKIDDEYETTSITNVGLTTLGMGIVILKTAEGQEFPVSAFSGEIASHIDDFIEQKQDSIPTIYNMIEQICEESELLLVKVKIYENCGALRANLYFCGKKDVVLRNFRASDAIALATFYKAPILIRKTILRSNSSVA
jgi:bifunctional DNase/RNase